MVPFDEAEDLPLGLMMQLGQNIDALNYFAKLEAMQKEQLVAYIKSAPTGDEVKNRIGQVIASLEHHQSYF